MVEIKDTEDFFKKFNSLENDDNLFDLKINNAYAWRIARPAIYECLQNKVFGTNSAQDSEKVDLSKEG